MAQTSFNPAHVIHVLATTNPKRPGTKAHAAWQLYKPGQTVAQFAAAKVAATKTYSTVASQLKFDTKHGYIAILPPGQQPKKPAPK